MRRLGISLLFLWAGAAMAADVDMANADSSLIMELSTDRGATPVYRVGEAMVVVVRMNNPGNVFCFYRQGDGRVVRIFPNRFHSNPAVSADVTMRIPDDATNFRIVLDHPLAVEGVKCFATQLDSNVRLASPLGPDATVLPLADLEATEKAFAEVARINAIATISIAVTDSKN